jgi:Mrp family chromosome partitioning ATPase
MEKCVMSLGAFHPLDLASAAQTTAARRQSTDLKVCKWDPEHFAREQIWGLVRQVFFASLASPIRQIVLTATESGTDVASICRRIGEALALETSRGVAVVAWGTQNSQGVGRDRERTWTGSRGSASPLLEFATQVRSNLWMLPLSKITGDEVAPSMSSHGRLSKLRREFEYSIVEGPPAGESIEAAAMGRSADGIILVLEAHRTRRAAAHKIKKTLDAAGVRVLGLVLTGRRFPIPDGIYRKL